MRHLLRAGPLLLVLAAAGYEPARLPLLGVLSVAFVAIAVSALRTGHPGLESDLCGAAVVATLSVAWMSVPLPSGARDGSTCADPLAPFALYRAAGAVLVVAAALLVTRLLRLPTGRAPSLPAVATAVAVVGAIGGASAFIGPSLAEPFFGPLPIAMADPAAIVPALVFALANAAMEETAYRGVLLSAVRRWQGAGVAVALQAAAFGLAHGVGGDFAGSPLPVVVATAAGGVAFGMLALRTGSLVLPIAFHAGLDIPIYYANACLAR